MDSTTEYNGDECVVLPVDYMKSIDAAVELYDDDLAAGAPNLKIQGFEKSLAKRAMGRGFAVSLLWLLPAIWIVCV